MTKRSTTESWRWGVWITLVHKKKEPHWKSPRQHYFVPATSRDDTFSAMDRFIEKRMMRVVSRSLSSGFCLSSALYGQPCETCYMHIRIAEAVCDGVECELGDTSIECSPENARLIAAAPLLLAACRAIRDKGMEELNVQALAPEAWKQMLAAIEASEAP